MLQEVQLKAMDVTDSTTMDEDIDGYRSDIRVVAEDIDPAGQAVTYIILENPHRRIKVWLDDIRAVVQSLQAPATEEWPELEVSTISQ